MVGNNGFFSKNHERLLKIADWSKILSYFVILFYVFNAGFEVIAYQLNLEQTAALANASPFGPDPFDIFKWDPLYYAIDIASNIAAILLQGVVYYLVLRGVYLGLKMIVETDINYREHSRG